MSDRYELMCKYNNILEEVKCEDAEIFLLLEKILDDPIALEFDWITLYQITTSIDILKHRLGYE